MNNALNTDGDEGRYKFSNIIKYYSPQSILLDFSNLKLLLHRNVTLSHDIRWGVWTDGDGSERMNSVLVQRVNNTVDTNSFHIVAIWTNTITDK